VATAVDLDRAPWEDVCVAMAPVTRRCGLLHLCISSSLVQRDPTYGGGASGWLPGGGSFDSWGASIHGEKEIVV
jgi:hypothetical protein